MAQEKYLNHTQPEEIEAVLVGHRVTQVGEDVLELDDGTQLQFLGNSGCGGCSSGWYNLCELADVDNIITRVELDNRPDDEVGAGIYSIFVFAAHQKINLATFVGSDGNGCYGTGYEIRVTFAQPVAGEF